MMRCGAQEMKFYFLRESGTSRLCSGAMLILLAGIFRGMTFNHYLRMCVIIFLFFMFFFFCRLG